MMNNDESVVDSSCRAQVDVHTTRLAYLEDRLSFLEEKVFMYSIVFVLLCSILFLLQIF